MSNLLASHRRPERSLPRLVSSPHFLQPRLGPAEPAPAVASSSDQVAFVALAGSDRELWHLHCSPYSPRYSPTLRRPAPRDPFCQRASTHRCKYPDADSMRTMCTAQTQYLIAISMLKLLQQAFY